MVLEKLQNAFFDVSSMVLTAVAGLNWGSTGVFGYNLVENTLGKVMINGEPWLAVGTYGVIGLAGVYQGLRIWNEFRAAR